MIRGSVSPSVSLRWALLRSYFVCSFWCKYRQSRSTEEPKGQPATSVLEEASESDGGGQRTSASVSSKEVTAEPTVQAESTSAISVTAISSEVVLQEQTVASSEQRVHHKIRLVKGLSEKPVTVNETREASASDLAAANNTSSTSSDNFDLRLPT